jgi:hypothetical protein
LEEGEGDGTAVPTAVVAKRILAHEQEDTRAPSHKESVSDGLQ